MAPRKSWLVVALPLPTLQWLLAIPSVLHKARNQRCTLKLCARIVITETACSSVNLFVICFMYCSGDIVCRSEYIIFLQIQIEIMLCPCMEEDIEEDVLGGKTDAYPVWWRRSQRENKISTSRGVIWDIIWAECRNSSKWKKYCITWSTVDDHHTFWDFRCSWAIRGI